MLNIKRIDRVPIATIYSLTETAPLIVRVRLRQLRLLGHVLRLPENEPVREFAVYVPTHGRGKPGRQRTLFTNYIHCLLGDPDSLLNDNQLWKWLKTAINGGNLWSPALQPKDDDDDCALWRVLVQMRLADHKTP